MRFSVLGFIAAVSAVLLSAGCAFFSGGGASEELGPKFEVPPILKVGVLREGVSNNVVDDLERSLLALLEKRRGVIVERAEYSREEILFALRHGEVDVIAAGLTDADIKAAFLRPCAKHLPTGRRVAVHKDIAPFITDLKQLDNGKVVVYTVAGTVSSDWASKLFRRARKASLKNTPSCVAAVSKGTGGVFLLGPVEAWRLFTEPESQSKTTNLRLALGPLTRERLAWAVRRGDTTLANALDEFMENAVKRGELKRLVEKSGAEAINR
jgi:ABC-type amino acid transport substrate-binding protein